MPVAGLCNDPWLSAAPYMVYLISNTLPFGS